MRAIAFRPDFMTVSITTPQEVPETAEILRFLHRFAELMSRGSNSENLLRAARLLEAQMDQVKESNELLRVERVRSDTNLELRMALEGRAAGLESEMTALKLQLSETELRLSEVALEAEQKQGELLRRAEEAEAQLAAARTDLANKACGDTHVLVPVTTLHRAKAQFESLAAAFEKSGNIVSQVMCEASASNLDRVIVDAGASEAENRSNHAA
jgi:mRNA-degrading endonuclease toxin of MazEF toxin-antitoxin module